MSRRKIIRKRIRHLERGFMVCSPSFLPYTGNPWAQTAWLKRQVIEGRV